MALPKWLQASEFEFRYRSPLNFVHFAIAFLAYYVDDINVVQAVVWWFAGSDEERARTLSHLIFGLGALLVFLAALIRTWAAAYLGSHIVHDRNLRANAIVADGPFRYLRNPLYLGTFLLSVGLGLLTSRLGFVILVGGAIIRILRLIGREEAILQAEQGETFREYRRRVPRLLPALTPRVAASGMQPSWGQAFWGEAFMWGFFAGMATFAVTLRTRPTWIVMGAALLLWFLQSILGIGRKKPA
jgi:protein-S-isoprenylcysteine O-methyltransferase Ste14